MSEPDRAVLPTPGQSAHRAVAAQALRSVRKLNAHARRARTLALVRCPQAGCVLVVVYDLAGHGPVAHFPWVGRQGEQAEILDWPDPDGSVHPDFWALPCRCLAGFGRKVERVDVLRDVRRGYDRRGRTAL